MIDTQTTEQTSQFSKKRWRSVSCIGNIFVLISIFYLLIWLAKALPYADVIGIVGIGILLFCIYLGLAVADKRYWATKIFERLIWIIGVVIVILCAFNLVETIPFFLPFYDSYSDITPYISYIVGGVAFLVFLYVAIALNSYNRARKKQRVSPFVYGNKRPVLTILLMFILLGAYFYIFVSPYPFPTEQKQVPVVEVSFQPLASGEALETGNNGYLILKEWKAGKNINGSDILQEPLTGDVTKALEEISIDRGLLATGEISDRLLAAYKHTDEVIGSGWQEIYEHFSQSEYSTIIAKAMQTPYFIKDDVQYDNIFEYGLSNVQKVLLFDSYKALQSGDVSRATLRWQESYALVNKLLFAGFTKNNGNEAMNMLQLHSESVMLMLDIFTVPEATRIQLAQYYAGFNMNMDKYITQVENAHYFYAKKYIESSNSYNMVFSNKVLGSWFFDKQETLNRLNLLYADIHYKDNISDYQKLSETQATLKQQVSFSHNPCHGIGNLTWRNLRRAGTCLLHTIRYNSEGNRTLSQVEAYRENEYYQNLLHQSRYSFTDLQNKLLQK